jgi:hypothetical protein
LLEKLPTGSGVFPFNLTSMQGVLDAQYGQRNGNAKSQRQSRL